MKFFLAQNAPIDLTQQSQQIGLWNLWYRTEVEHNSILPVSDKGNVDYSEEMVHCTKLKQRLVGNCGLSSGWWSSPRAWLHWEAVSHQDRWAGIRILSGSVTNALIDLFGFDVKIRMEFFQEESQRLVSFNVKLEEMKDKNGQIFECGKVDQEEFTLADITLARSLTVIVIVNESNETKDESSGIKVDNNFQDFRNMLHEELGSDLAIMLDNGTEIKAHKGVLMARSDVFKAMFLQEDTKEAQSSTVKITEISEEGARALLAYLYCFDDSVPKSKPLVAFEMFRAGHKYNISMVETAMKELLLSKPTIWFDADAALELFHFAKKLPEDDGKTLKMKAVKVMKANFEKFKKTDAFVSIFNEEPELAMEICAHFAAL